ncbi:leucine-rich repeat protein [Candidatus Methanomassiliicoccus intestinalis]|uniref:leucine-rich repeat protein n=1 Tax=Candidatus Methanomassiliicoccus intestinalis TaxID=1406512 RepID=UPI0037DD9B00
MIIVALAIILLALPNFEDDNSSNGIISDNDGSPILEDIYSDPEIAYRLNEDGCSVTVQGLAQFDLTDITIPEVVKTKKGDYAVTAIAADAFVSAMSHDLKEVRIEASGVSIGTGAFYNCASLEQVVFAGSVREIGELAFYNCNSLKEIEIEGDSLIIDDSAFMGCSSIVSLKLSGSIVSIGQYAFVGCTSLDSVNITGNLEKIDNNAFYRCQNLKTVNLPAGMKSIGNNVFKECHSIESCIIDGNNKVTLGNNSFYDAFGIRSIINESPYLRITASSRAELITSGIEHPWDNHVQVCIVIPSDDTVIEDRAFRDTRCSIVDVIIHDRITKIGMEAFAYTDLFKLNLPDSITYIGDRAFKSNNIQTLVIPGNVVYIGDSAFDYCTGLSSVSIPKSVEHIGEAAFAHSKMKEVYFSHSDMLPEMPDMKIYGAGSIFYNCQKNIQRETHDAWYPTLDDGGLDVYIKAGIKNTDRLENQFNNLNIITLEDHVITFDPNGGSIDTIFKTVKEGEKITPPAQPPVIRGNWGIEYNFIGWYYENEPYSFDTPASDDIVLTAAWERTVTDNIGDNNLMYFLIIIAAIIIIVITAAYIYIKKR